MTTLKNLNVFLALLSQHNAHSRAVLDDSLSTIVTTSLDQNKLYYCSMALSLHEIYDDVMPMNDTKK